MDAPFESIGRMKAPSSLADTGPQSTAPLPSSAEAFAVEITPKNSFAVPQVDPSASSACPIKDPNVLSGTPLAVNRPPERALPKTVAATPGDVGSCPWAAEGIPMSPPQGAVLTLSQEQERDSGLVVG